MAAASFVAPRPRKHPRLGGVGPGGGSNRPANPARRIARVPLALPQRGAEYPPQFRRRFPRWEEFPWRRRLWRRWRVIGWRRGFRELVMSISAQERQRVATAI